MNTFATAHKWDWLDNQSSATYATDCPTLLYTLGQATIQWGQKRRTIHARQLLFILPNTKLTIIPLSDADGTKQAVISICYGSYVLHEQTRDKLTYNLDYEQLPENGYIWQSIMPRTQALVEEIAHAATQIPPDSYTCDRHLHELLHQFSQYLSQVDDIPRPAAQEAVLEIMHDILENCALDWRREAVARSKRFHTSHFSRAFHKQCGCNFRTFLGKVRLNRARILLLSTNWTLDKIAREVGMLNGLYLSRRFKLDLGLSPSAFRTQWKIKSPRIATLLQSGDLIMLNTPPIAASYFPWHHATVLHEEMNQSGVHRLDDLATLEQLPNAAFDFLLVPDYLMYQSADLLLRLDKLAAVIFLSPYAATPPIRLQQLAALVGKRQQGDAIIKHVEEELAQWLPYFRKRIAADKTAAVYELRGDDQIIIWPATYRGCYNLYHHLQLRAPDAVQHEVLDSDRHLTISYEQLPLYAADHMFVIRDIQADDEDAFLHKLTNDPVWSSLATLRQGRIYSLPLRAFWSDDMLSLLRQLPLLAAAMNKRIQLEDNTQD